MTEVSGKPVNKGDIIELEIESLAFGAEGVGHFGGLAVFVEDTVPGDVVKVRIGSMKRKFARGYVQEFVKKSPIRIAPKCRHFGSCGGCALQFIGYADQLKIKEQHVRDAIVRLGGFDGALVKTIIGCKEPWYYRNKMEFSFSREFADGKPGMLTLGLHVRRRHHDVTELAECFLMNDYAGALVAEVRDFFRKKDTEGKLTEMRLLNFTLREGKNSGEVMVNLSAENGQPDFLEEFTVLIRAFFDGMNKPGTRLSSVFFTQIINFKGRPKKTEEVLLWGAPHINESLKAADGSELIFRISPQAFFQPNTRQAEVLYALALEAAAPSKTDTVFDLFCGAGTIGCFCARRAGKVYGIELNRSAVANAKENAAANALDNIEFIAGDVGKVMDTIGVRPDIVITDPPRGGIDPNTLAQIAAFGAGRIVYVSCNPSTLARDLSLFKKTGYSLLSAQPVDMFPQTYHIECVAVMEK
jgi:23S rRNA (uracil1939-C5)-methyltransferase